MTTAAHVIALLERDPEGWCDTRYRLCHDEAGVEIWIGADGPYVCEPQTVRFWPWDRVRIRLAIRRWRRGEIERAVQHQIPSATVTHLKVVR